MSRLNLGILITFSIVLLLLIGNGGNSLINYFEGSPDFEFSNETVHEQQQQLPQALQTTRSLDQLQPSQNFKHQSTPKPASTLRNPSNVNQPKHIKEELIQPSIYPEENEEILQRLANK